MVLDHNSKHNIVNTLPLVLLSTTLPPSFMSHVSATYLLLSNMVMFRKSTNCPKLKYMLEKTDKELDLLQCATQIMQAQQQTWKEQDQKLPEPLLHLHRAQRKQCCRRACSAELPLFRRQDSGDMELIQELEIQAPVQSKTPQQDLLHMPCFTDQQRPPSDFHKDWQKGFQDQMPACRHHQSCGVHSVSWCCPKSTSRSTLWDMAGRQHNGVRRLADGSPQGTQP